MMIGKFDQNGDGYVGSIYSELPIVTISPVPAKHGNGPDFVLIAREEHEEPEEPDEFEVGAAWKKTSKDNKPYLSVKLDGPMLSAPINCVCSGNRTAHTPLSAPAGIRTRSTAP